jgi:hypothetical protein
MAVRSGHTGVQGDKHALGSQTIVKARISDGMLALRPWSSGRLEARLAGVAARGAMERTDLLLDGVADLLFPAQSKWRTHTSARHPDVRLERCLRGCRQHMPCFAHLEVVVQQMFVVRRREAVLSVGSWGKVFQLEYDAGDKQSAMLGKRKES